MRIAVVVCLLSGLCAPALASPPPPPIVGGTAATLGEYPAVVLIEVGQGLCTGTLIDPNWVLTAGHCVTPSIVGAANQADLTASVVVHYNTVNPELTPGLTASASETIPDPMYAGLSGQYDSGLIHLSAPITTVTPVTLNLVAANAPVGIAVTQVGFGETSGTSNGTVGVEYEVAQMSVGCAAYNEPGQPTLLDANLLCFNQSNGKGKCDGDSGGPSFAMIKGKLVEVGITSFGDQTCSSFGADTRVDAEAAFIEAHVPIDDCTADTDCAMDHQCFDQRCIVTPFQPTGLGSSCQLGTDCESGQCASDGTAMECTMACTIGATDACPTGLDCIADGATGTCWASTSSGGGCCDARGASAPTMLFGIALVGVLLRRRRVS